MIVVCPLSKVHATCTLHAPERVVSILDPEWPTPDLGPAYMGRHLRLRFHDVHAAAEGQVIPGAAHIRAMLRFLDGWERSRPLVIHCRAGIGRSTAAAFVAACHTHPELDEQEIALALRRTAPLARPNETLVRLADAEMGRNGRMSEAIASTGRGLSWIDVEEGVPFVLAYRSSSANGARAR